MFCRCFHVSGQNINCALNAWPRLFDKDVMPNFIELFPLHFCPRSDFFELQVQVNWSPWVFQLFHLKQLKKSLRNTLDRMQICLHPALTLRNLCNLPLSSILILLLEPSWKQRSMPSFLMLLWSNRTRTQLRPIFSAAACDETLSQQGNGHFQISVVTSLFQT